LPTILAVKPQDARESQILPPTVEHMRRLTDVYSLLKIIHEDLILDAARSLRSTGCFKSATLIDASSITD
jgi:hypothetical protein